MSDSLFGFTSSFVVPTVVSIAIGTTPITSGTNGRLLFDDAGVVGETNGAFWDKVNGRFGLGTPTPTVLFEVNGPSKIQTLTIGLGNNAIATNTALGYQALLNTNSSNTGFNTAVGYQALNSLIGNGFNTAVGYQALKNSTASTNTAVGFQAGLSNSAGDNVFIGYQAALASTNTSSTIAIGAFALLSNISGTALTAIGRGALENTTGSSNIGIGFWAGRSHTTGTNNIFIGNNSAGVSNTDSDRTWIGNSSTTTTWLAGNLLIGTTTNAGFKADINGTMRVQGKLTVSSGGFDLTGTLTNFSGYQGYGQMQLFSGSAFQMFNSSNNSKSSFQYTNATGLSLSINPENLSGVLTGLALGPSLVASANNDTLVALDVAPAFTNGAFTGVTQFFGRFANGGGGTSLPATTGTSQTGGILRLGRDNAILDIGSHSAGGAWIQSANRNNLALNYNLFLNPNGGNILMGTTVDAGFKVDVNGTMRVQNNFTMPSGTSLTVGSIQLFDDTAGTRVIQALSNQSLLVRAGSNAITLRNSAGGGDATFSTTGSYTIQPNGITGSGGINIFGSSSAPSSTTISFKKIRNDGAKSGIINSEDFAVSGSAPINLFIYAGKETVLNNQANLILCHDGTTARGNTLIGTTTNITSAIVNVESTTQGVLFPRMTTAQKNAIASPTAGLVVYDTTLNKLCVYTTTWETVTSL